jgi:hypothetical protein
MFPMRRLDYREIRFEKSVPKNSQPREHRTAENHRISKRSAIDVFYNPREARFNQNFPDGFDQAWPFICVAIALGKIGIRLARRRSMNCVELSDEFRFERESISPDERQRIIRLGVDVYTDNVKSDPAVTHPSAAGAAEKIKKAGFPCHSCPSEIRERYQ